jgi:hypothetical protein
MGTKQGHNPKLWRLLLQKRKSVWILLLLLHAVQRLPKRQSRKQNTACERRGVTARLADRDGDALRAMSRSCSQACWDEAARWSNRQPVLALCETCKASLIKLQYQIVLLLNKLAELIYQLSCTVNWAHLHCTAQGQASPLPPRWCLALSVDE